MKALTSAISLIALLGALVVLPGCGGGDEAAPPADTGADATAPDITIEDPAADPGLGGAMEGPAADPAEAP